MKKKYNLIIIGAGPAGLMARNIVQDSLLIEKNNECGLKLLITGNGSSNITHEEDAGDAVTHYYEKKHFVSPSIYSFPPSAIMDFFDRSGVKVAIRSDRRVFPKSGKSYDIRNALLKNENNILYDTTLLSIRKEDDTFALETTRGTLYSKYCVVCTGGMSYSETGSDGSGYKILNSLGHKIVPPSAALSSLILDIDTKAIEGVTVKSCTLKTGRISFSGAICFTRDGISGPAVLNISRYFATMGDLTIKFLDAFSPDDVKKENGKKNAINALSQITSLPDSMLSYLFPSIKNKNVASLTKSELKAISSTLLSWRVKAKTGALKRSMVTRGGVDTNSVDSHTMESKLVKDLYIIGEVLDVDGECGGYNLSFAFSSAVLAGKDILRKMKDKNN